MAEPIYLNKSGMDAGVESYRNTPGAVLLDVRTPDEYRGGHIPGSVNIPLDDIRTVLDRIPDRAVPLFIHCRSGLRSGKAALALKSFGYKNVTNIGGILDYYGALEKS